MRFLKRTANYPDYVLQADDDATWHEYTANRGHSDDVVFTVGRDNGATDDATYDDSRVYYVTLYELFYFCGALGFVFVGVLDCINEPDDKLVLSTVHQAKGLEWPIVFVLWVAEGSFPTAQSMRTPQELEEERRLFYVAVTRAADELYLLYPTIEEGREGPRKLLRPSRFLHEIDHDPAVFERWEIEEVPRDDA